MKPATAAAPPGGKKAAGPLIRDAGATAATNLGVLRRTDPDIEEVLGTAGHVCLYGFDVDAKLWVRARLQAAGARRVAGRCGGEKRASGSARVGPLTLARTRARRRAARRWRAPSSWSSGAARGLAAWPARFRSLGHDAELPPAARRQAHAAALPVHHHEPAEHRRAHAPRRDRGDRLRSKALPAGCV